MRPPLKVYLCGSISDQQKHIAWRQQAERELRSLVPTTGFHVLNPLRYQDPVNFSQDGLHDSTVSDSFMADVDMMDVARADVLLVVFWKQERQSVGTWMEMGAAAVARKPIVLVTNDPLVADHPFIHRFASVVCKTVEEGIAWVQRIA